MPSINDVYNQLVTANGHLQNINNDLVTLNNTTNQLVNCCNSTNDRLVEILNTLNAGFTNVSSGLQNILLQQVFTNYALVHLSQQTDTVICNLEKISDQTCGILNESHIQTELQHVIKDATKSVMEMFKTVHPEAALESKRVEDLNRKIIECCPPPTEKPLCTYELCRAPREIGEPPKPKYEVFKPMGGEK